MTATTSVLIAGGGPVGLGLACELGLRGIDCMLVEKRDGAVTEPKQSMVSSRNMEFCRRWGVAQAVRTAVWPESYPRDFVYLDTLRGREVLRVRQASFAQRDPRDYTPEAPCPCPQIYFDPILMARMRTFATVRPHYNTSLDAFTQDDEGVEAHLTDQMTGHTHTVRARYLVGCDGPAGTIREQLGIRLEGRGTIAKSLNLYFRSAELPSFHDKGWARFYRVIDETGCWGELIPMDGKELWRLTVFDAPLSKAEPDFLLRKMAGGAFAYEMLSVSPWDRRDYIATSYRVGRVFISGDAAHQCSPTGGIGMHTGLEEVVNLAWKLEAMLAGWGGPALLASYEAERRPIAVRNVEYATRTYNAIASIPGLRGADDPAEWNKKPPRWLSIPEHLKSQYCYEGSPICAIDDAAPELETAEFVPSTRPGSRAPHAWLADGRSTLDLFGEGFVLLRLGADPPDATSLSRAAAACGVPLSATALADPDLAVLHGKPLVLVRPDGHVAWRGDEPPADAQALVNRVRGAEGHAEAPAPMPPSASKPEGQMRYSETSVGGRPMSAQNPTAEKSYEEVRAGWKANHIRPLWENPIAHKARDGGPRPHLWPWSVLRPAVDSALKVTTPAAVERRVLQLVDPESDSPAAGTTTNISANLQVLLPGEKARPHRHTMNALRFVMEGKGAYTVVDGKSCLMEEGDLVITPGWTWHEHVHKGSGPIVWMDALDAPLHRYLGTDAFEPGPVHDVPELADDAAFAMPNIVPDMDANERAFSPVFRYPWAQAAAAVAVAPAGKDGARRVRYVNPLNGGSAMQLMDCYLTQIDRNSETVPYRTTSNAVCCVVEGNGTTRVGDDTLSWGPKDIFSLPHGNWITHRASSEKATLFVVTDRDTLRRLDLLKEQYGNR